MDAGGCIYWGAHYAPPEALEELFTLLHTIAPQLKLVLVMDRWFASDTLFTLFEQYGTFHARGLEDYKVKNIVPT